MKFIYKSVALLLILISFSIPSTFGNGIISDDTEVILDICKDKDECGIEAGIKAVKDGIDTNIKTEGDFVTFIQEIVAKILSFLYFIIVLIIIYAGFVILTAGGEEDKVTKGKKIIIYALIGLIVIFLAGPLADFIFSLLATGN